MSVYFFICEPAADGDNRPPELVIGRTADVGVGLPRDATTQARCTKVAMHGIYRTTSILLCYSTLTGS